MAAEALSNVKSNWGAVGGVGGVGGGGGTGRILERCVVLCTHTDKQASCMMLESSLLPSPLALGMLGH